MNRQKAQQLLARLILGELDEPTQRELRAYLETDPELRRELAAMRRTVGLLQGAAEAEPAMQLTAKRRAAVLGRRGTMRSAGNPRSPWWQRQIAMAPHYALAAGILLMAGLLMYALLMSSLGRAWQAADVVAIHEGEPTDAAFADDLTGGTAVLHRHAGARESRTRVEAESPPVVAQSEPPSPVVTASPSAAEPTPAPAPNMTYHSGYAVGKSGAAGTGRALNRLRDRGGGGGGGLAPGATSTTEAGADSYSLGSKVTADSSDGGTVVLGGTLKTAQPHGGQVAGQTEHWDRTTDKEAAAEKARSSQSLELALKAGPADRPVLPDAPAKWKAEAEKKLQTGVGGAGGRFESYAEAPAVLDHVGSGLVARAGGSDVANALEMVEGGTATRGMARPSTGRPAKPMEEATERLSDALDANANAPVGQDEGKPGMFDVAPTDSAFADSMQAPPRTPRGDDRLARLGTRRERIRGEASRTDGNFASQTGSGSVSGLFGSDSRADELRSGESRRGVEEAEARRPDSEVAKYAYNQDAGARDSDGDALGDSDWALRTTAKDASGGALGVARNGRGPAAADTSGRMLGDESMGQGQRAVGITLNGTDSDSRRKHDVADPLALPQTQPEAPSARPATVSDPFATSVLAESETTSFPGGPGPHAAATPAPAPDDAEGQQKRTTTVAGDKIYEILDLDTGQPVAPPDLQQAPQGEPEHEEASLPPASQFAIYPVNPWELTAQDHQSTFGLDVDTASYTLARRYLRAGYRPPHGAIRMEEFVNAFDYNYPQQQRGVFSVHAEGAPNPFARPGNPTTLLKIGVRGKVIGRDARRPVHLVFVVDTSGSMARPDRLPLVQYTLTLLISELKPTDKVSLVTYGNEARLIIEAVPVGKFRPRIAQVIQAMQAGGSTNMIEGMQLGYAMARRAFVAGQTSRVILCSDGVANIGETDADAILKKVEHNRDQGITFTAAGFGFGAYNDQLLEQLANRGDGNYVFIDSQAEAREQFVDRMSAMLQTIAKDAKIQVEFNPKRVRRYRLIGYENRAIADEQFRDDTVDAGEVGSGQSATAMYELELTGESGPEAYCDLGTVYVRYRNVETGAVEEINRRLESSMVRRRAVADAPRFYLAACAAQTAELLRGSEHAVRGNFADVQRVLTQVCNVLPLDNRAAELLWMTQRAEQLPPAP
jgi:Ca-activated chloride channel family protein